MWAAGRNYYGIVGDFITQKSNPERAVDVLGNSERSGRNSAGPSHAVFEWGRVGLGGGP